MKLRTFIDKITKLELRNTHINYKTVYNNTEHTDAIIEYVNDCLNSLYTEFLIKKNEIIINAKSNINFYYLRSEFANSNESSTEDVRYIIDSDANPFKEDIVRVIAVYDNEGNDLPIDVLDEHKSVYLPEYDCIQILNTTDDELYSVIYQRQNNIIENNDDQYEQVIDIPQYMETLLRKFVAGKIYMDIGDEKNNAKGMSLIAEYEILKNNLYSNGIIGKTIGDVGCKMDVRGFI